MEIKIGNKYQDRSGEKKIYEIVEVNDGFVYAVDSENKKRIFTFTHIKTVFNQIKKDSIFKKIINLIKK